jgi:hypothetical protein
MRCAVTGRKRSSPTSLAMPKSSSFGWPSRVTMMFDGLMSRWMTRLRCACDRAPGHAQHQPQTAFHIGQVVAAEIGDRDAFDVFHREEGRAVVGFAAVDQLRDVRMTQASEDFLFLAKAVAQAGMRGEHQLDRHLLLEAAVDAMREIDRAHAARTEQFVEHEGADAAADLLPVPVAHTAVVGHRRRNQIDDRPVQRRGFLVFAEQAHHVGAQAVVGDGVEDGRAFIAFAVERRIEQLADGAPALSIHDD